jgi:iron uptake system EfeUOB component EfeO/EfeM
MQSKKYILPILLATSLALVACGSKEDKSTEEGKKTEDTVSQTSISDGAKEMKVEISDLKKQIVAKDEAKVKENAENLEKSWQKFEDGVKDKDAALYEKVETPLHIIEAGAKVNPLDDKTLNEAANDLDSVLSDVEKLK